MKFEKQVRIPKKKGGLLQQLEVLTCLFPEAVDVPSLEVFQAWLDRTWSNVV